MSEHDFVHLHVHTEYSLLDGLSQIDQLVDRAKALNMPALAITDHGTMFGVIDFFRECQAKGVKPIIGVEAYLARRSRFDKDPKLDKRPYHMLLLAKDQTGYLNLLQLVSKAQLEGYYYRPRIDRELLAQHAQGLIATSGCLAAQIPSAVMDGKDDEAREIIGWYQEVFGAENFFLELQQHDIPELETLNKWLVDYRKSGHSPVQLVATNDVHYVLHEDYDPHDTLLCIQTGALKTDQDRLRMTDPSYHLTSQKEMWKYFKDVPEALSNTLKVAEMCSVDLNTKGYHLPVFPVPTPHTPKSYMRMLCEKGMRWRYGRALDDPQQREILTARLDRELDIISGMGFDTYFLIVWDLCQFAQAADIWYNVRGSGAGSMVAYCLEITNIDPIENNLLFERFLNPGRVSMPDIDIDYPDDRRAEMIRYAARKYGEEKVAAIITFGTMGPKAAVKDVGRALNVPLETVNRITKLIPQEAKPKPLQTYIEENPELQELLDSDSVLQEVAETAKKLQGVSRHVSVHAAGIIIGDKPLVEYLPLHRMPSKVGEGAANKNAEDEEVPDLRLVTQFPMETCESIGLLKVDFLGLSTLTIMRKACELIARHHGVEYSIENIPYRHEHIDDPTIIKRLNEAFDWLKEGRTVGVFQLESSGMRQTLREVQPSHFEHIVAVVSLYRPGPLEFIPQYANRMHGKEAIPYHHPKLETITGVTYGVITYQEQVMQIAGDLFGYELGEADLMRRAVSKKKEKDLLQHKAIFMERGPKVDPTITAEIAEKIFDEIAFFANYGFNRSHAADYGKLTVQSAYLKRHYTEEYMTALLCVHSDTPEKITVFLTECRELGIPILPPDVNYSNLEFDIENTSAGKRAIRFGMAAIKNAGVGAVQKIIDARNEGGKFASLDDFCRRVDLRAVGKRAVESITKVGALDSLGNLDLPPEDRRLQLVMAIERMVGVSHEQHDAAKVGQMNMFGGGSANGGKNSSVSDLLKPLTDKDRKSRQEILAWEKELLGVYATGRPMDKLITQLARSGATAISDLKDPERPSMHGKQVKVAGEVTSVRKVTTKNSEMMGILNFEDWQGGVIEIVCFPRTWKEHHDMLEQKGAVVMIVGKFDASRTDPQIVAEKVSNNFTFVEGENGSPSVRYDNAPPAWAVDGEPEWRSGDDQRVVYASSRPPDDAPPVWEVSRERPWLKQDEPFDEETGEVISAPLENAEPTAPVVPATQGAAAVPVPDVLPTFGAPADPPLVISPDSPFDDSAGDAAHWVIVYIDRSYNDTSDRNRLRKLHGLLTSYPGTDRFSLEFEAGQRPLRMEFPNHYTAFSEMLIADLFKIGGVQKIEVWDRSGQCLEYK